MSELVRYEVVDRVAVITIDNPPVNALSPGVPEGIDDAVARARRRSGASTPIVLIGAGYDVHRRRRHQRLQHAEDPRAVARAIGSRARTAEATRGRRASRSSRRFTATRSAAGSKFAMACHYRVAVPSARVGQPEVLLGIIPGAGGTQRLPRLCGAALALEMCTDGKPLSAARALEEGIVDRVVDGDLLEGAIAFARARAAAGERAQGARADRQDRRLEPPVSPRARRLARRLPRRRAARARRSRPSTPSKPALHDGLRRRLGARARAVRRLRRLDRVARAPAPLLRRARGRQDSRRAEGHAGEGRSRAPPSSAPGRWAAASR